MSIKNDVNEMLQLLRSPHFNPLEQLREKKKLACLWIELSRIFFLTYCSIFEVMCAFSNFCDVNTEICLNLKVGDFCLCLLDLVLQV